MKDHMSHSLEVLPQDGHDRSKFLGGADVSVVLGINPWRTWQQMWADKRRPRVEGALSRRDPKARGIRWEAVVGEMLVESLEAQGHTVEVVATNRRYRDATIPYLASEIDWELRLDGSEEITNCELKTVHPFKLKKDGWGESGSDSMPIWYTAQVMHGLGVTGRRNGMLAALFGADELRTYPVPADEDTIAGMRAACVDFWTRYVLGDEVPPPQTAEDLARLYPRNTVDGAPLIADTDLVLKLLRMRAANRTLAAAQAEVDELEFAIKAAMRDASTLLLPTGKTAAEWKLREGKALDHEKLKAMLGAKGYREAHTPWASRIFSLKSFALEGLEPHMNPITPVEQALALPDTTKE